MPSGAVHVSFTVKPVILSTCETVRTTDDTLFFTVGEPFSMLCAADVSEATFWLIDFVNAAAASISAPERCSL